MGHRPRPIREEGRVASAWALSIVGHVVATGLGGLLLANSLARPPIEPAPPRVAQLQVEDTIDVELPPMALPAAAASSSPPQSQPPETAPRGGGEGTPRLDTGRAGRGGTDTANQPALNLADRDDGLLLSPEMRSRLDRSQIQRIKASVRRLSREDWRASREPMELTFLASGNAPSSRPERRTAADRDPSSGARDQGAPRKAGGALGAADLPAGFGEHRRDPGGPVAGADRTSAGLGIRDGAPGNDHRDSAAQAHARPMVQEGTPSVPSNEQGKPTDNKDSEQEVALAMQSILHASTAGGAHGPGTGGKDGPGPAGSGGIVGPGSTSRALGNGQGPGLDVDPRDRRRSEYARLVHARIGPHVSPSIVPMQARIDGVQLVTTVTFTILADGSVAGATVTRPSGLPEVDEKCRQLVLRLAPYAPLPAELGASYRIQMPFDFRNQAVLPRNAKAER